MDSTASSCSSATSSVDVVALERGRRTGPAAAGAPRPARRPAPVGADRVLGQRGPGPLQRAVHRGHGGVQQLGDLGRLPLQHLAQDQHRALAGRQVLQRGDERQPHRLPGHRGVGRVAAAGQHLASGTGVEPGALRQLRRRARSDAVEAGAEVHRPGPPLAPVRAWSGRRWWRSGTARSAPRSGPRTCRRSARRGSGCPAPRPRRRPPSRASGSSSRSARPGTAPSGARRRVPRPVPLRPPPRDPSSPTSLRSPAHGHPVLPAPRVGRPRHFSAGSSCRLSGFGWHRPARSGRRPTRPSCPGCRPAG